MHSRIAKAREDFLNTFETSFNYTLVQGLPPQCFVLFVLLYLSVAIFKRQSSTNNFNDIFNVKQYI